MIFTYQKLPVRVLRFFKLILPKTKREYTSFKSIKANVIEHRITYQLHDTNEMIVFCKKANLNVYRRAKNTQNDIKLGILKTVILPDHVTKAYFDKNHDFIIHLDDEFVFIVYSEDNDRYEKVLDWNILMYDIKRRIWSKVNHPSYELYNGIYGVYYLKRCKGAIFLVGKPVFSDKTFHKAYDIRRGFDLLGFYYTSLTEPTNNRYEYYHVFFSAYVENT